MLALQVSIGVLNDLTDRRSDAGVKPSKPLPRRLVGEGPATLVFWLSAGLGLLLSAPSGLATLAVAATGAALGYAYDLRLSRTPWSWLPLAAALPLLPVHAWLGATGSVPPGLLTLVPAAILAGAALALANGLVDLERDRAGGRPSATVLLGRSRAWAVHAVLLGAVAMMAIALAPSVAPSVAPPVAPPVAPAAAPGTAAASLAPLLAAARTFGVGAGVVTALAGALVLRAASAAARERGWELEAVAVAMVGLGWLAGAAGSTV